MNESIKVQECNSKKSRSLTLDAIYKKYGIFIALIVVCVIISLLTPKFLTIGNTIVVLRQISINSILAIGVTFVILTGGIDLSLGSVVAVSGVIAASLAHPGEFPLIVPILIGMAAGVAVGLINGLIVTKGNVAPFITTLGMMTLCRGLALVLSKGMPVSNLSKEFAVIGGGQVIGVPITVIVLLIIFIVSYIALTKTKFGRYVYATGGNAEAARASGINTGTIKILVYVICSGLAGISGVIQASRITTGQPNIGVGYELDAIAAVVIGGVSLVGGIGSIAGTIVGALIIGVISNGLDLLNVYSYYQQIIKGIIIIGAVLLDSKNSSK